MNATKFRTVARRHNTGHVQVLSKGLDLNVLTQNTHTALSNKNRNKNDHFRHQMLLKC